MDQVTGDSAAVRILDGPTITTTTAGWRLPRAITLAATRLPPPPWDPGQTATAIIIAIATGTHLADATATIDITTLAATSAVDIDDLHQQVLDAHAATRTILDAHHNVRVGVRLPDHLSWPAIDVDCDTGDCWVRHEWGTVPVGPAVNLPARWADLAVAARLARHPVDGWVPARWVK